MRRSGIGGLRCADPPDALHNGVRVVASAPTGLEDVALLLKSLMRAPSRVGLETSKYSLMVSLAALFVSIAAIFLKRRS